MARSSPFLEGIWVSSFNGLTSVGTKTSSCCNLSKYIIIGFKVKQYLQGTLNGSQAVERQGNGINSEEGTALCRPLSDDRMRRLPWCKGLVGVLGHGVIQSGKPYDLNHLGKDPSIKVCSDVFDLSQQSESSGGLSIYILGFKIKDH